MSEKPTKFADLTAKELYRSATEDFAVPVEETDKNKKKVLLAALVEAGVEWGDYVEQHPDVAPEEKPKYEPTLANTVQGAEPVDPQEKWADPRQNVRKESIRVNRGLDSTGEPYLIKMERDNLVFETRGYRFTRENPYALVDPKDAEYILRVEDGFRQAFPSELEEFYG